MTYPSWGDWIGIILVTYMVTVTIGKIFQNFFIYRLKRKAIENGQKLTN